MSMLDIASRRHHLPSQLSTGQMQRVAIARALINNPSILLADEPTGNLDSKRSDEVKQLFLDLNKHRGISIIFVTHNPDFAKIGHNLIEICDGKIVKNL
jgi:putative ABC transport system ATP-binding protein